MKERKSKTIASSGSRLGSTPNISKSAEPAPVCGTVPSTPIASSGILRSPDRMGEERRTSEINRDPGGTETRCLGRRVKSCYKYLLEETYELSPLEAPSVRTFKI